jgi:hypothetical protein
MPPHSQVVAQEEPAPAKENRRNPKREEDAPLDLFINKPFKYASVTIDGDEVEPQKRLWRSAPNTGNAP